MARTKKLEILNVSAFAKLMQVSSTAVNKWIDTGKITEKSIQRTPGAGKPNIIVEYAVEELKANETPGAIRRTRGGLNVGGNTRPDQKTKPDISNKELDNLLSMAGVKKDGTIEVGGYDMSADPTDYASAKIQEQIARAQKLKLEVAEKKGELVDKREQDLQLRGMGITLKQDLITIPDRVAANCFAAESQLEIRNIIYSALEQVLTKYAQKIW